MNLGDLERDIHRLGTGRKNGGLERDNLERDIHELGGWNGGMEWDIHNLEGPWNGEVERDTHHPRN